MKQISVYRSIREKALLASFQNIENFFNPKSYGLSLSLRLSSSSTASSKTPIAMNTELIIP